MHENPCPNMRSAFPPRFNHTVVLVKQQQCVFCCLPACLSFFLCVLSCPVPFLPIPSRRVPSCPVLLCSVLLCPALLVLLVCFRPSVLSACLCVCDWLSACLSACLPVSDCPSTPSTPSTCSFVCPPAGLSQIVFICQAPDLLRTQRTDELTTKTTPTTQQQN